jgi:hypothetical protein
MQPIIIFIAIQFLMCGNEVESMQYTVLCCAHFLFRIFLLQILLYLKCPSRLVPRKYLNFFPIPPDSLNIIHITFFDTAEPLNQFSAIKL